MGDGVGSGIKQVRLIDVGGAGVGGRRIIDMQVYDSP